MNVYPFFFTECPICHLYKFRSVQKEVFHAHFVICHAIEELYERVVIIPNRGRTRDTRRTIVDVEIGRMYDELHGTVSWVNPFFVIEEDKIFLSQKDVPKNGEKNGTT